jgi:hypothetical protein
MEPQWIGCLGCMDRRSMGKDYVTLRERSLRPKSLYSDHSNASTAPGLDTAEHHAYSTSGSAQREEK